MLWSSGTAPGGVMHEQPVMFEGAEVLPRSAERDRQLGSDLLSRGFATPLDELQNPAPALRQTGERIVQRGGHEPPLDRLSTWVSIPAFPTKQNKNRNILRNADGRCMVAASQHLWQGVPTAMAESVTLPRTD